MTSEYKVSGCWTGGAGYLFNYGTTTIGVDLYLSDSCYKKKGIFKRIVPSPFRVEDITVDYLIVTHIHCDHFDEEILPLLISAKPDLKIIAPTPVVEKAISSGVKVDNTICFNVGMKIDTGGIIIEAVPCDHGTSCSHAIGVILSFGVKKVYFTGDMQFRDDFLKFTEVSAASVDTMIVPINGRFGNPNPEEAALMVSMIKPRKVIPTHFWLFIEHGGNPADFLSACSRNCPDVEVIIPSIGEYFFL